MAGAITGIPEVDNMTPSQAFHAGRRCSFDEIARLRKAIAKSCDDTRYEDLDGGCARAIAADVENKRLRAGLNEIADHGMTNGGDWCAEYAERVLEQQFDGGKT